MKADFRVRPLPLLAAAGLVFALAGCSQTTYGTGKSIGSQTVADFANIAKFKRSEDPIEFKPRPPVVAPPQTAALPVPGAAPDGAKMAANWPQDPDLQTANARATIAAAQANGTKIVVKTDPSTTAAIDIDDPKNYKTTPEQAAAIRAARAKQGAVPVDANGVPQRQFLSDPPGEYLAGDPTAPPPSPESKVAEQKPLLQRLWQRNKG